MMLPSDDCVMETSTSVESRQEEDECIPIILGEKVNAKTPAKCLKSPIWFYFVRTEKSSAKCLICLKTLKTKHSTTSCLHNHLRRKHKKNYEEFIKLKNASDLVKCSTTPDGCQEPAVNSSSHNEAVLNTQKCIDESEVCVDKDEIALAAIRGIPGKKCRKFKRSSRNLKSLSKCVEKRIDGRVSQEISKCSIWSYYQRIEGSEAKCNSCADILKTKYSCTSSLHNHLRRKHRKDYDELIEARKGVVAKQSSIVNDQESIKVSQNQRENDRDIDILTLLILTNQSFSLVEERGFVKFLTHLNPMWTVKSREFFADLCSIYYEKFKAAVNRVLSTELPACESVIFTMDTWISDFNDLCESLTIQYVNDDFKMQKLVTDCRSFEGYNDSEIANMVDKMIEEIPGLVAANCHKYSVIGCVESARKAVSNTFQKRTIALESLCHVIHNAAITTLKQKPFNETVTLCTDLASSAKSSPWLRQKIKKAFESCEPSVPYRAIVEPEINRLKSLYHCLMSILKLKRFLPNIWTDENAADHTLAIPTAEQFKDMEELIGPLTDIKRAFDSLYSNKKPTIHLALVNLTDLRDIESKYRNTSERTKLFCADFKKCLQKTLPNHGKDVYEYCLANFLHPGYKGAHMTSYDDNNTLHAVLKRLIEEHQCRRESEELPYQEKESSTLVKMEELSESRSMNEVHVIEETSNGNKDARRTSESDIIDEIRRYRQTKSACNPDSVDIFDWWSRKRDEYPILCRIARRILCIPASTSVSDEMFFVELQLDTSDYDRLNLENVEQRIYIRENYYNVNVGPIWDTESERDKESSNVN